MVGSVEQRVRPMRFAFLVDARSETQVRESIRLCSTLWGGSYCPIVQVYKRTPKVWREQYITPPRAEAIVRGYVSAFDPDILVQMGGELPAYVKDLNVDVIRPGDIWKNLDDPRSVAPENGIGVFEILSDIFDKHFKFQAKYPPRLVVPTLPNDLQLFWASVFGEYPAEIGERIRKRYYEPLEIEEYALQPERFGDLLNQHFQFPRRLSSHAIKHSASSLHRNSYVFFLDARKIDDVIDYWNLRAVGRSVLPIPKQLKDDATLKALVQDFLRSARVPWPNDPTISDHAAIVRSKHSTVDELQEFAESLIFERGVDDSSQSSFFSLQHWYPRIWDDWARSKDGVVPDSLTVETTQFDIDEHRGAKIVFRSRLPAFARGKSPGGGFRCVNEISFWTYGSKEPLAHAFPQFSGESFLRAVAGRFRSSDGWRIGRSGLVRLVSDEKRDEWELPSAEEVFFAWLKDHGWVAELSSAGRLSKQLFRQLDGYPSLLKNERLLGLLEHMNGGLVQASAEPVDEIRVGSARELKVGEIKTRLRAASGRDKLLEYLLDLGVFRLGIDLQCPNCYRRAWYSLNAISETIVCPQCLDEFRAIGSVDKGSWAYRTAGPFSVPRYADGAYTTLLALDFFGSRSLRNRTTPVTSFQARAPNRPDVEIDFALFWQDSALGEEMDGIAVGECKTYGCFAKKDFDRMRFLADTFPGAVLVFATLRKHLKKQEIDAIARIAKRGRKQWKADRPINPVLVLTGTELLSHSAPPGCWAHEASDGRFRHVHSLLQICNATQQLHLGLESWENAWMRRRRRGSGNDGPSASTG